MSSILWILVHIFLNGMLLCIASGKVQYYDFVLKETNFTRLCSTKSMLTVNDSFPGPTIRVHKGDTVYVNVHNRGKYGVTIHWHGVKQPRNPWSDGPENITQCPIPPNTSFTQEIIFSTEEGTLWWHAHSDWSRATVHGAIIILPTSGTNYPFPKPYAEQTIVLGEWYKGDVMAIIEEALSTGADPNISDAYTINGQPGDLYKCSKAKTYRLLVDYGKTYLLRIINAVMNEEQFFGIAKHNLTVVGSDAAYIKPITTNYIMITPGQTMDVLVTVNQSPNQYYIVSTPFADTTAQYDTTTTTAILQYRGNYTRSSSIPFPTLPRNLPMVYANNFPNQPPYYFNFTGDVGNDTVYPSTGTNPPENHPMHLHGFSFFVVGMGSGNFNNKTDPKSYNLIDPPEVNTFGVRKNGWLAIRFIADNPGVWFMHCHLERHASWGMDTVLIVKNGGTSATSIRPPPKYMPPCSKS
uniref:laccase n=1 Tax=Fagus sylvatica TaxID=28930 RepID=A0A2N9F193_FAGSY